jgi:hypothetical protein
MRSVCALGIAASVLATSRARAIDPAINLSEAAGSVCQPRAGLGSAQYGAYGRVGNDHTSQLLQVDCPIPFLVDDSYGDDVDVYINVRGNGSSLSCTVYVEQLTSWSGIPSYYTAGASTTAVGNADLHVHLPVFEGLAAGVMHVFCNLPAKNASGTAEVRGFMTID